MCSYTSSLTMTMSVPRVSAASCAQSAADSTLVPGLFGVLTRIIRVRGVSARRTASQSMRYPGSASGSGTGVAPASRIAGM